MSVAALVCAEVVHEERDFATVEWPEIRKDIRDARGMAAYLRSKGLA